MEYIDLTQVGPQKRSISSPESPSTLFYNVAVKLEELILSRSPFFAQGKSAYRHLYSVSRDGKNQEITCEVSKRFVYDPCGELRNFIERRSRAVDRRPLEEMITPSQKEYFDQQIKVMRFGPSKEYYVKIPSSCGLEDVKSALYCATKWVDSANDKQKALIENLINLTMAFPKV